MSFYILVFKCFYSFVDINLDLILFISSSIGNYIEVLMETLEKMFSRSFKFNMLVNRCFLMTKIAFHSYKPDYLLSCVNQVIIFDCLKIICYIGNNVKLSYLILLLQCNLKRNDLFV